MTTKWNIDNDHSRIQFLPYHMGVSFLPGSFNSYEGYVEAGDEDFNNAKTYLKINSGSLFTGNEMRDKHLNSDEFLNTEKFPEIIFKGQLAEKTGANYKMLGEISIRDKNRELELDVTHNGTITDPYGLKRAGFRIAGKLNRFDFDINYNEQYNWGPVVAEEVELVCYIEVTKAKG